MSTIDGPVTYVRPTAPRYTAAMTIRGKVSDAGLADELELNTRYFRTLPAMLKLLQIVLAIVALCCISPPLTVKFCVLCLNLFIISTFFIFL